MLRQLTVRPRCVEALVAVPRLSRFAQIRPTPSGRPARPQADRWGGQDSNLRPTDHEFDPARLADQGEWAESVADQQFRLPRTVRRFAAFRSPSRDTSLREGSAWSGSELPMIGAIGAVNAGRRYCVGPGNTGCSTSGDNSRIEQAVCDPGATGSVL